MSGSPSAHAPEIPDMELIQHLGSGGFADVFLYQQLRPYRQVAVKVLRDTAVTASMHEQFIAEANNMASLSDYPNVVPVYSVGEAADGRPYIVMAYYSRANLQARAANKPLRVTEVLRYGIQIACAIESAHRLRILHRDVKPANILTRDNVTVALSDFGVAAHMTTIDEDDDPPISPYYCAPEVMDGDRGSEQSDIYSLGATLWFCLVGHSPFIIPGGENHPRSSEFKMRVRTTPAPPTGRTDVPPSLERQLRAMLAKEPSMRPRSALDVARSLQAIERELGFTPTQLPHWGDDDPDEPDFRSPAVPDASDDATARRTDVGNRSSAPGTSRWAPPRTATSSPRAAKPLVDPQKPVDDDRTQRRATPAAATPRTTRRPEFEDVAQSDRKARREAYPEGPTQVRVTPAAASEPDGDQARGNTPWRWIALTAVVAVAIVAIITLSNDGANDAASPTSTPPSATSLSDNDQALPPGVPTVTGHRVDDQNLAFEWNYAAALDSDTYKWQTTDGAQSGVVDTPTVVIAAPSGTSLCIQVKVVRADGSFGAVNWSPEGCAQ